MKKVLFIEPFFGGSHKEFAEGLVRHSAYSIDLVTLPARNWTWRMNGSALYFALSSIPFDSYDAVITTSMTRISDLKGILGQRLPPVLVYFHENQVTYPLASGEKRDSSLCMNDISTVVAADRIVFNSSFHLEDFISGVSSFMKKVPDYPVTIIEKIIRDKSSVIYPGMTLPDKYSGIESDNKIESKSPLVIWNHRWSFDKNAPSFFYALQILANKGIDFNVAVMGETSGQIPDIFKKARHNLGDRIVQYGYVQDKELYDQWLKKGTIIVSTSFQENFGMSVVEAVRAGSIPLLPNRLSYPELIPQTAHDTCIYSNQKEFLYKLEYMMVNFRDLERIRCELSQFVENYSWNHLIREYDDMIDKVCSLRKI